MLNKSVKWAKNIQRLRSIQCTTAASHGDRVWMDGWMDGRMDGSMDGWIYAWLLIDKYTLGATKAPKGHIQNEPPAWMFYHSPFIVGLTKMVHTQQYSATLSYTARNSHSRLVATQRNVMVVLCDNWVIGETLQTLKAYRIINRNACIVRRLSIQDLF